VTTAVRRESRRRLPLILAALAGALLVSALQPARVLASACTPPVANAVACENTKTGTPPGQWQTEGAGDPSIQGFATSMSVNAGDTVRFKIKTDSADYHIDILRLGYYNGDGARTLKADLPISATLPQVQPGCTFDNTPVNPTGLVDCGNWAVTASWTVPSDAVSGVYIAHLVRDDPQGGDSQIPFVVRNDSSNADMVVQTSDETWQAYNAYGGNSLYSCTVACPAGNPDAYKGANSVSYNRPFDGAISQDNGHSYLYYAEYQMIRFLEENGYDLTYVAGKDVDGDPSLLLDHKVFISSGHDEYWTGNQRTNVEDARDAGVNLAFFSGNEVFWKTRFEAGARTLTTYKETHYNAQVDPAGPSVWTGTFVDSRFSPPGDGGNPPNALNGQLFKVNSGSSDIVVPARYGQTRFWRGTSAASLTGSQSLTLYPGGDTLGYEWDVDADNGFRPAGTFRLSSTTVPNVQIFTDFGSTTTNGPATHNMTLYRAASNALVFGAGTVQWAWGLDDTNAWHLPITNPKDGPVDRDMQQATVNLFADMGVQPYALIPGLNAATMSTDHTAPSALITSPSNGATVSDGTQMTVTATASDSGGQVAGVEISTDGGTTWHPATPGTGNWTYTWIAHGNPTAALRARAVDDSGNLSSPTSPVSVNVNCDCSLFGAAVPASPDGGDPHSVELGVKFKTDHFGTVNGIRFYKASANTGTHIGSLWTADGQRLAQATFTSETSSGWQTVTFPSPVPILADTTYVASYYAPNGHYSSSTPGYFNSPSPFGGTPIDAPPLHAIVDRGAVANGMFSYSSGSTFPTSSFKASNYYVDVKFSSSPAPGQATGVTATAGAGSASLAWTAPSTGGPPTKYVITPYIGATAQPATTVTGSPPATTGYVHDLTPGQAYTFKVTASNPTGDAPASASSNSVTPGAVTAPTAPQSVVAVAAGQKAKLTWLAPANDGGRDITGYTVTPYIGAAAQTPIALDGSTTTTTVTGLTNSTTYTFTVTATNAVGTSPAGTSNAATPDDTIFDLTTPAIADAGDGGSVQLGVKFQAGTFGVATGVRFYKSAANTGTHIGSLWDADGTRLAQATFTNETASGWQQVRFSAPVALTAGQVYVVSYSAPNGHYSVNMPGFSTAVTRGSLTAFGNGTTPNGTYVYGSGSSFPDQSFNASNYWVDVTYAAQAAPAQATNVTATAATGSAQVSWTPGASGGMATKYVITPYIGATAQPATTVTGTPAPATALVSGLTVGQAYTFKVTASNPSGTAPVSAASNSVTPDGGTIPGAPTNVQAVAGSADARVTWTPPASTGGWTLSGYTVTPYIGTTAQTPVTVGGSATSATVSGLTNATAYTFRVVANNVVGSGPSATSNAATPMQTILDLGTPATSDDSDSSSVELGVKFRADSYGFITGIRFYKAAGNTGTHTGSLWTSDGTRLAQVTFANETASGWQTATFSTPVTITAGTTYVASYFAPSGHYSLTPFAFSSAVDSGPLHALADSASSNGLFRYSATSAFPNASFHATSYWVDVTYAAAAVPGAPSGVSATAGPASANVSWTAPSSGGPVTQYTVTPYIGATAQPATTVTGTPPVTTASVTGLTGGQAYTFKVTASNPNGSGAASAASSPVTPSTPVPPGTPQNVMAAAANGSALVRWSAPSSAGDFPITGYTVTPYAGSTAGTPVQAGASVTSATVNGLTNGTAYTFRVTASSSAGTGAYTASNAVTPNRTIFELAAPASDNSGDPSSVVLGVKFRSDVAGTIAGIRFYKSSENTGSHVGALWSAGGSLLTSGTFTGETASGWQELYFASPVGISAGTTYVATYFAPNGHYAGTSQAFNSAFDNAPLHALATTTSPNGVFAYSGSNVFPTNTWNAGNYWVDVLFVPGS
jgi:hypothetical protein